MKKKISLDDLKKFTKAAKIIIEYKELKKNQVDLSEFFLKKPTKKNIEHLFCVSEGNSLGFMSNLLFVGDIWAKEFGTELTPEIKKFISKNRKKIY